MKAFALKTGGFLIALWALVMTSCRTIQLPIETSTEVNVKDSLVINIKDSVRITERSVYKDYAGLLDTLRIKNNERGVSMTAWADTTNNLINGTLETEPVEEKTRIVYKDRIVYRDSIQRVETPVPVEVTKEVKVIPKFYRIFSILGVIFLAVLSTLAGLKLYRLFKGKKTIL